MSRYVIQDDGRREVVVGWDPPLGTFFAQIFAPQLPEDEEELIWWVGGGQCEVPSLSALQDALRTQGIHLNEATRGKLNEDSLAPWEPGPLQRALGFTGKEEA